MDALRWLQQNHEDYQNVTIDNMELNKWPSIFITEALLSSIARMRDGEVEDEMRDGFTVEQIDVDEFQGSIPNTVSGIIDVNNISRPHHLLTLQQLQTLQGDFTINVVPGSKVLEHYEDSTYFTSAFPTLFPWGTGKHIDDRRKSPLQLKRWVELLLRNSSRYITICHLILYMSANDIDNFRLIRISLWWLLMSFDGDKLYQKSQFVPSKRAGRGHRGC